MHVLKIVIYLFLQLQNFEQRYAELQQELMNSQDKNRQSLHEISAKEEETVVLKVELSALQEKYKVKIDEVRCYMK